MTSAIDNQFIHSLNRYKKLFEQDKLSKSAKLNLQNLIDHHLFRQKKIYADHMDEVINLTLKSNDKIASNGKIYSKNNIGKIDESEKESLYFDILDLYKKKGKKIVYGGQHPNEFTDAESVISHELGHFAHYKRLNTKLSDWSFVNKKQFEDIKKQYPNSKIPSCLTNFFGEKEQKIAGDISFYAQSAIDEFVAEVYKYAISGKKLSPDVIRMYKKYKGPEVIFP